MNRQDIPPDRRPLTELQAGRLAALTGLDARELRSLPVVEIQEKFRWQIDPEILLFRRVCGRVIKKDPVTGEERPVPFATVHVEDTDLSLLGYFPPAWSWGWFFPLRARREEIATVVTDACGRFCVWIPRWEIDWILRFRHERVCFPDIFLRPSIRDLLDDLRPEPPIIRWPIPEPDPPPFLLRDGGLTMRRAEEILGQGMARQLLSLEAAATLGSSATQQLALLDQDAFPVPLAPPLPEELKELPTTPQPGKKFEPRLAALAARLDMDPEILRRLNLRRFAGPFRRCFDVITPEWMPLFDVPDITFRVTQDVDGDGNEETIYSEGYFDVRWNAGPIPDVTLYASQIAVAGVTCDTPDVPCDGTPAITFAGLMPLVNPPAPAEPYHDAGPGEAADIAPGYARRPNRPHPSGLVNDPPPNPRAETPYTGVLLLYGCNHAPNAQYYRLVYSFNGGPEVPFTGLTWPLYRLAGGILQTMWPTADASGWYPVLPDADGWTPQHLLLSWPTAQFQNGLYRVSLQLGNAAKAVISTSTPVRFQVDNTAPAVQFTGLAWRVAGAGGWTPLELICPVVVRPTGLGGQPADIEFRVSYQVMATHLRSLRLTGGGCGGAAPLQLAAPNWSDPPSPVNPYEHWHTDPDFDNSEARTALFVLPGAAAQGAYSFNLFAASRAFNPSDPGGFLADWNFDPAPNYVSPSLPVAVVNA